MANHPSEVAYEWIVARIWPMVLEDKTVYADDVIRLMIEQELLLPNHLDLIDKKADERDQVLWKRKESQQFGALNRYLQNNRYYRILKRKTAGNRVRLDFVNDGVYLEQQVFLIPSRAVKAHAFYTKRLINIPEFVDEQRQKMLTEYGQLTFSYSEHGKAIEAKFKLGQPLINESMVKVAPAKKTARRKA